MLLPRRAWERGVTSTLVPAAPRGMDAVSPSVEILVSLALTIFILSILAQAFVLGSDTFRTLKVVGDLNDSGCSTAAYDIVRSDLAADHFEGKRRLSDTKFWNDGPPVQGYFVVWRDTNANTKFHSQSSAGSATDPDGLPVSRSASNVLAFTSKTRGNRPQNYYSAQVPSGSLTSPAAFMPPDSRYQPGQDARGNYFFSSQWIEVCWFLTQTKNASKGGTPLFALYRQPRLVVGDVDQLNWGSLKVPAGNLTSYKNKVSCQTNPSPSSGAANFLYFNSPADLTIPQRRTAGTFPPAALANFQPFVDPTTNQPTGEDLVLQDVLSLRRAGAAGGRQ